MEREEFLSLLPVEIQVSESEVNATRVVSLGNLQEKGKQSVIIVAGKSTWLENLYISIRPSSSCLFM